MPSPDKRQRKKENARAAREAREAQEKKRKRNRTIRSAAIAVVVFALVILVITLLSHKNNKKVVASPTTSTTVAPATTTPTTVATTGATVPAAELAAVKCNDTKPAKSTKNTKQTAPAMTIDPTKTYTAVMSTSCGDITIALDAKDSPKGVNNFVFLARQGFYDGLTFHRVVTNFVIQGGDPAGDGSGSPGYQVVTEMPKAGYPLGTLAWAKTSAAPDGSAGSQFFVVTSDHPASLEQKDASGSYQYGAFGHVTSGIAVAKKMEGFAPASGDGTPTRPLYIFKVTITEK